jgi:hypothetical protein
MSKLEYLARPLVAFDPANKQHREWYYDFLEYGGWGRCPVRFIVPENSGLDLTIMIRNALIEYYVYKEFKPKKVDKIPKKSYNSKNKVVTRLLDLDDGKANRSTERRS